MSPTVKPFSANLFAKSSTIEKSSSAKKTSDNLMWVDQMTHLLDTKFRIPGTNLRFGADFILGLVPGAGDLLSMGVSGVLISTMAREGASGRLVARMLLNVALDTIVGSVPVLGNFFDLFYKANRRNLLLMREHYVEGKHRGSVWPVVVGVFAFLAVLFVVTLVLMVWIFKWLWNALPG